MMDAKGFLSKLRRQVGFHHRGDNTKHLNLHDDEDDDDVMYEDYVLVEDDFKEEASVDGLPTYSSIMMEPYRTSPPSPTHLPPPGFNTSTKHPIPALNSCQPPIGAVVPHQTSAVGDIPFQLHPSLNCRQRLDTMFHGVNLHTSVFNWDKYSHDFCQEKRCLRDLTRLEGSIG